jgi:hypothetical protein
MITTSCGAPPRAINFWAIGTPIAKPTNKGRMNRHALWKNHLRIIPTNNNNALPISKILNIISPPFLRFQKISSNAYTTCKLSNTPDLPNKPKHDACKMHARIAGR